MATHRGARGLNVGALERSDQGAHRVPVERLGRHAGDLGGLRAAPRNPLGRGLLGAQRLAGRAARRSVVAGSGHARRHAG